MQIRSTPLNLQVKWKGKLIEIRVNETTKVKDVLKEVEKQTNVPFSKQKYSPSVLRVNDQEKQLFTIKFFAQNSKDTVKLLMIGIPTQDPSTIDSPVPKSPSSSSSKKEAAEEPLEYSELCLSVKNTIDTIKNLVVQLSQDIDRNSNCSNANKLKKMKLCWAEKLTQTQLKLDAIHFPEDLPQQERQVLRKLRKETVLLAEKLIVKVESL